LNFQTEIRPVLAATIFLLGIIISSTPALAESRSIEFKVIRDVDRVIGISEIENMPDGSFGPERVTSVRSNYGERSLWIRIEDLGPVDLVRLSPVLDEVTLFVRTHATSPWQEVRAGDQIDQSARHLLSAFMALPIPKGANTDLMYVRVVQPTAVAIKLQRWSKEGFEQMEENDKDLKLFLFGFVLAALIYNLFVSALLRESAFFFNALTIASLLVFSLYLSGYGVAIFWVEWTGWSNAIQIASIYTAIVFGGTFLWQFLKTDHETLSAGWPIVYSPVFVTIIVILSPVLPFWLVQLCTLVAGALLLLSTLVFVCRRAWDGDPKAKILIFPLLFAVIPGLFLVALDRVFGIGMVRYSDNALEITFCVEALLFSLALVARVRIGEQETRVANENVLRLRYENSVKSVEAQDNERRRLAKELHDGVGQNFLSVVGSLKSLAVSHRGDEISQSLNDVVGVATSSLNELRRISKDMHPSTIEHLGLKRAIEQLFENLESSDQIETDLTLHFNETYLTPNMELNVYRIFQECLSNVSRHADATLCRAAIVSRSGCIEAYIEDDGSGMEHEKRVSSGLGLISIEERVAALGGNLRISESEQGGTKIAFGFPLRSELDEEAGC